MGRWREGNAMSVPKSQRGESSMQFIQTARELKQHTLTVVKKCPKRLQFFLLAPIYEEAREVLHSVKAANNTFVHNAHEAQIRADYLGRANVVLQNLTDDLEDLYEELINDEERYKWVANAMQKHGELISAEAKLIGKVRKSDKERYKGLT